MTQPHPGLRRQPEREQPLAVLKEHCLLERREAGGLAHDDSHLVRVTRLALALAQAWAFEEEMHLDLDVLEAACWLHEAGRGHQEPGESLAQASARRAEDALRVAGLDELVWPVCELLLTNDPITGRTPDDPAGQVLHDADALDDLGAFGLFRMMADPGGHPPRMHHIDDPGASDRATEPAEFLVDRILERILEATGEMLTPVGEALARERIQWLHGMHEAMILEASGRQAETLEVEEAET